MAPPTNRRERRDLIRQWPKGPSPLGTLRAAAIEIQRVYRGFLARRRLRDPGPRRKPAPPRPKTPVPINLVAKYLLEKNDEDSRTISPNKGTDYFSWVAIKLQRWWRRILARREYQRRISVVFRTAARVLQRRWRERRAIRRAQLLVQLESEAAPGIANAYSRAAYTMQFKSAARIQRVFRAYMQRKVYAFYRDLIKSKEADDARVILRAVNPAEAGLLDAAAGLHVRLRLGGSTFPPTIFYKIFTHINVSDIGAFAPRPYDLEATARTRRRRLWVVAAPDDDPSPKDKWYERIENNGWRPVQHSVLSREWVPGEGDQSATAFHFSKVRRRADVQRRKKMKKLAWLRKMYGIAKSTDTTFNEDRGPEAYEVDYLMSRIDAVHRAPEQVPVKVLVELEDEAAELLAWSDNLDYDAYVSTWTSLATVGINVAETDNLRRLRTTPNDFHF
ncbi:IQ calmodulin-binding motif [Plasmodiophora brassicae]|nr:hypothetical protein PBRA_008268 [Plasmodiophora brassicae]